MARTSILLSAVLLALACAPAAGTGGGAGSAATSSSAGGNANPGGLAASTADSAVGAIGSFTTRNLELRADGSVALGPGFLPTPVVLAGVNGGPTEAYPLGTPAGASCAGYVPLAPQHVIDITAPIPYLRIVVDTYMPSASSGAYGSVDSTLLVRMPGGAILCDDDGDGDLQPAVSGPALAGRLEIFVGAYSAAGSGARYKLALTENPSYSHTDLR